MAEVHYSRARNKENIFEIGKTAKMYSWCARQTRFPKKFCVPDQGINLEKITAKAH